MKQNNMEKLKCIRTVDKTKPFDYQRIINSEAEAFVKTGDWVFTTKAKYQQYIDKHNAVRFTTGNDKFDDEKLAKIKVNAKAYKSSRAVNPIVTNSKSKRFYYQIIGMIKRWSTTKKTKVDDYKYDAVKQDKGFTTHESITHLKGEDPITGEKIYSKEGKGIPKDFIVTSKKGELRRRKTRTIKHKRS